MTREVITVKVSDTPSPVDQLKKLATKMLLCRALGHSWPHVDGGLFQVHERNRRNKIVSVRRDLKCAGCGMTRGDVYSYSPNGIGPLMSRSYQRPEGYYVTGGRAWRHDADNELLSRQELV